MTPLANILISIVIVGYMALCVFTAMFFLLKKDNEIPTRGMKSYYTYTHGKYVCYTLDIAFVAALVLILVLWLAKNIELGL